MAKETNEQKVKNYFTEHPDASNGDVARALGISKSTVCKYKPTELKAQPLSEEEKERLYAQYLREREADKLLNLNVLREVKNANRYRLYPIEWGRIRAYYVKENREMPFACKNGAEFEQLMKKYFGLLYDWNLYEKCPECGKGICIPVFNTGQFEPYCACSESDCYFSVGTDGEPVTHRPARKEWNPPIIEKSRLQRTVNDLSKIICLDVETTGLDSEKDEILQLSIIDGNGVVLFNEYIKPKQHTEWPEAEQIHGISLEMVQHNPIIDEYVPRLNKILSEAELIVGYNCKYFDLHFLLNAGIRWDFEKDIFDVMLEFAPIYGEWDYRHYEFKWQNLATCAAFYDYESNGGSYHDSLEDVKATLHCYLQMTSP